MSLGYIFFKKTKNITKIYWICKMEDTQIEQGIRLKTLMKALGLNQTEFAASLGMTQPNVNRMVSGRNNISMEVLNGLGKVYKQVNLHWLLTGHGEMFLEESLITRPEMDAYSAPYKMKERLERVEEFAEEFFLLMLGDAVPGVLHVEA